MEVKAAAGEPHHVGYLAGLRGWAALLVFFTHIRDIFCNDLRMTVHRATEAYGVIGHVADALYSIVFSSGQLAVYTFWTLSGYVLSLSYFRLRNSGRIEALAPWARQHLAGRYLRLYLPVAAVCLLSYALANLGGYENARLTAVLGPKLSDTSRYFVDFHPGFFPTLWFAFVQCPFGFQREFDPPLWTISYELWGSVLVFTMLAIYGNHPRRFIAYAVGAVVAAIMQPLYLSFIVGLALADVHTTSSPSPRSRWRWLLIFPAIFVVLAAGEVWRFPQSELIAAICLLVVVVYGPRVFHRFLSSRFSNFLGDVSYGLYLLHYLVLCSLGGMLYFWLRDCQIARPMAVFLAVLLLIPPLFLAAWIFHRWIDIPATAFARRVGRFFS